MQNITSHLIYTSAIVYFLSALLLFANRREGDRSRMILAGIQLYSGFHFALYFVWMHLGSRATPVISAPVLIMSSFGTVIYLIYSIEVVSPYWLNLKRISILLMPVSLIVFVYIISLCLGVDYIQYNSLIEMIPHIKHFDVWFRFMIALLLFVPVSYLFFVPYTKKYNNANGVWMRTYVILITINSLSYLLSLLFCDLVLDVVFYYTRSLSRLIIVYIELFVRINGKYTSKSIINKEQINAVTRTDNEGIPDPKSITLFGELDEYMRSNYAWRDPDITMLRMVRLMKTNRTTLAQVIQEQGYENYTTYVNKLRIEDFIQIINSGTGIPFHETFFDVGFRSRTTALRNFRKITGTIPSDYFSELNSRKVTH